MDFKKVLEALGKRLDESQAPLKSQLDLAKKRLDQPEYQPSEEEMANEQKYYEGLASGVAGSIAPIKGAQIADELARKSVLGQRAAQEMKGASMVEDLAEKGALTMEDLVKQQQAASRAADAQTRLAQQIAARRRMGK
jgi:hypothetical protein